MAVRPPQAVDKCETWLCNHHCDGRRSAWRDPLSTVAQFLSSLDSNTATGEASSGTWRIQSACSVHWSVASGPWCSRQRKPAVFSPNVCFSESCHTGPCVYDGDRLLNKRTRITVTALIIFAHIYSVYTVPNTCRPTCTPPVKVRWWPSRLSHIINIRHWELSSVYYIGLPTHQTPATAVDARWWQAALLHSTSDYRPNKTTTTNKQFNQRLVQQNEFEYEFKFYIRSLNFRKKNEFNIPSSNNTTSHHNYSLTHSAIYHTVLCGRVSEWVSSLLMAHRHILGYIVVGYIYHWRSFLL